MEEYNYYEAAKNDVIDFIENEIGFSDYDTIDFIENEIEFSDYDTLEGYLNETHEEEEAAKEAWRLAFALLVGHPLV